MRARDAILRELAALLRGPEDQTVERVEKLLSALRDLEKKVAALEQRRSGDAVETLLSQVREINGTRSLVARVDGVESKGMRALSDRIREKIGSGIVVLAAEVSSGVAVTVAVTPDQTERYDAGRMIKELVPLVQGRGGGKADFAQAGGKDPAGIDGLLEKANELIG